MPYACYLPCHVQHIPTLQSWHCCRHAGTDQTLASSICCGIYADRGNSPGCGGMYGSIWVWQVHFDIPCQACTHMQTMSHCWSSGLKCVVPRARLSKQSVQACLQSPDDWLYSQFAGQAGMICAGIPFIQCLHHCSCWHLCITGCGHK